MPNARTLFLSKTCQTTHNLRHKFFFPAQYSVPVIPRCTEDNFLQSCVDSTPCLFNRTEESSFTIGSFSQKINLLCWDLTQ